MTDKPTGVFVRLPLSDAHVLTLLDAYTGGKETTNTKMQDALLDIGTPVTGGELEVYHAPTVISKNGAECIPLVRQSDALAKLAEKNAEIAAANERCADTLQGLVYARAQLVQQDAEIANLRAPGSRLLNMIDGINPDWSNGVTDITGSIDEGDVIAGGIIDDFRKAMKGQKA
ncbi:hypothetical protein [Acetobacter senegalensis]|nr:hypothetical protein [Acetobacter senegalensis]